MTNTVDRIIESFTDLVKARLSDDLISTYFLSFFIFNWKIILLVLSKIDVWVKIKMIDNHLHVLHQWQLDWQGVNHFLFSLFVGPLLLSSFYLFLFPSATRNLKKAILKLKVDSSNDRYDAESSLRPIEEKMLFLRLN